MSRLFCICFFGTKIYPIFARMSKNENIINKVLIIDDEPQIRQLLARIWKDMKFYRQETVKRQ